MPITEDIKFPTRPMGMTSAGSAGLQTQGAGGMTTVSAVASATGGIRPGGMIETDR